MAGLPLALTEAFQPLLFFYEVFEEFKNYGHQAVFCNIRYTYSETILKWSSLEFIFMHYYLGKEFGMGTKTKTAASCL